MNPKIIEHLETAAELANFYRGCTSPNPPVGAIILDQNGKLLSQATHEKAGDLHAEAKAIQNLNEFLPQAHTLIVTLEPCNHTGKTPPCTEAILNTSIKNVFYGSKDPNPNVQGKGADHLKSNGINVQLIENEKCNDLIRPFKKWVKTGTPWITLKTAHRGNVSDFFESMIPPIGQKVFTNFESLKLAHELRRRSQAILTGSQTILADKPLFTIRHVKDHEAYTRNEIPKRVLCILDRSHRLNKDIAIHYPNFDLMIANELEQAIADLGKKGVQEVLVEAGPSIVKSILEKGLWDEHFKITHNSSDLVEHSYRLLTQDSSSNLR